MPLGEGDLIDILLYMLPMAWHKSMMTSSFEPMQRRPESLRKPKRISQKIKINPRIKTRKMTECQELNALIQNEVKKGLE